MLQKTIKHAVRCRERIPRFMKPMLVSPLIFMGRLTYYRRPMPDFLIIGAQKCGTTSLYSYLTQHPRVMAGYKKEVHFFDNPNHFRKGIKWYRAHFPCVPNREKSLVGEATPAYLCHPQVPERVCEAMPRTRLIVLLRNPVDRTFSHYCHRIRHGTETRSFESAIRGGEKKFSSYLARGIYADQLKRWLALFPREQFLILKSEALFQHPEDTFSKVTEFLHLPAWHPDPNMFRKYNAGRHSDMDEKTRAYLAAYFAPHNERLYHLSGEDFGWERGDS